MSVRRYEFLAGQHGYKVDPKTCESIPGSHTQPETVTAIDARDVEPLLDAARRAEKALGVFEAGSSYSSQRAHENAEELMRCGDALRKALQPFQSEEE